MLIPLLLTIFSLPSISAHSRGAAATSHDYPLQPVPFTDVHIDDQFWAPRIETNRSITIPYAFKMCEDTGRFANFKNAAATLRGEDPPGKPLPGYPFDDTDVYKVLEGASYCLSVKKDPKLDHYLDKVIAMIAAAQEPDGYLYTARTINPKHPHPWAGPKRWVNEEALSHELYDCGHLYEAAVAHYWATGKRTLLNVAIKNANLLVRTFGPGKRKIWPGHEIVEMGLAKMYRATGTKAYLDLAKFMIDSRDGGDQYAQANEPVVNQTEAVGHAVRAAYLYSGVADVAALTHNQQYVSTIDRLWDNVVGDKLYLTGGIGATSNGEAFGADYDLPNSSAYAETCAAVGNDFWNQRLFLLHGESKYVDVLERTLYNGLLSGVGLDGKSFFYQNPLASSGRYGRSPWFGCACCPGNITRFIPSLPGYVYAVRSKDLFVNLYIANWAKLKMPSGLPVSLKETTNYPWSGKVRLAVDPKRKQKFAVRMRIPGWAQNEPVPSDLYQFENPSQARFSISVNGHRISPPVVNGYAVVNRVWKKGDSVVLDLPMPIRRVKANAKVVDDDGLVAIQRGPVVYCAEGVDNKGGHVDNVVVPPSAQMTEAFKPALLDGVVEIKTQGLQEVRNPDGTIQQQQAKVVLVPYSSWANRGMDSMQVWLAESPSRAQPSYKVPPVYSTAIVTASKGTNIHAINDLHVPTSSHDAGSFFHWWPKKGTKEWVEFNFPQETTLSKAMVYWFEDEEIGGECRLPSGWALFYKDSFGKWLPVATTSTFGTMKDKYNEVNFTPVATTGLRLEVQLQQGWSAGIQQWVAK